MSFIGTVGVVAQQGNQGVAGPTGVSIAINASGGTDNALITAEETGIFHGPGYSATMSHTFSGSIVDINIAHLENGYENDGPGHPGYITGFIYAYLRATGASTYSWDASVNTEETSLSNSITGSITGSDSGDQDATSRGGTGFKFRLTLPAQGTLPETYAMPANNDTFTIKLDGTAIDAGANETDAQQVHATFRFLT